MLLWVCQDVSAVGSLYHYHISLFEIWSLYGLISLRRARKITKSKY